MQRASFVMLVPDFSPTNGDQSLLGYYKTNSKVIKLADNI